MPRCRSSEPRKKLPPPMTTAIWAPASDTAAISPAIRDTTSGSTPSLPPPNSSPDSFSRTRWWAVTGRLLELAGCGGGRGEAGCGCSPESSATGLRHVGIHPRRDPRRPRGPVLPRNRSGQWRTSPGEALRADLEAGEPGHRAAGLVEHGLDRLLAVGHRRLLEQDDLLEVAVEAALGDLRDRLLGLALLARGRLGDLTLVLHHVGRHLVASEVLRAHRRDLLGRTTRRVRVAVVL